MAKNKRRKKKDSDLQVHNPNKKVIKGDTYKTKSGDTKRKTYTIDNPDIITNKETIAITRKKPIYKEVTIQDGWIVSKDEKGEIVRTPRMVTKKVRTGTEEVVAKVIKPGEHVRIKKKPTTRFKGKHTKDY